jgi:hypothetical protein
LGDITDSRRHLHRRTKKIAAFLDGRLVVGTGWAIHLSDASNNSRIAGLYPADELPPTYSHGMRRGALHPTSQKLPDMLKRSKAMDCR